MSRLECEFCNKTFVSRATLRSHQKKNKACLQLQAQEQGQEQGQGQENSILCQYCNIMYNENEWKEHQSECYLSVINDREEKLIALQTENTELQTKMNIISTQLVKSMVEMKQMSAFIQTFCMPRNDLAPALQSTDSILN